MKEADYVVVGAGSAGCALPRACPKREGRSSSSNTAAPMPGR